MKKLLALLAIIGLFSCEKNLGGDDGPINIPSNTTITGTINTTTTLTSDKTWTLKGYVYVTDGAKLIIQPGTTIVSDIAEKGALCIERGAQIIAEGTPTKPIIFTFQTFAYILEWDVIVFARSGLGFVPNNLYTKPIEQLRIICNLCFEFLIGLVGVYVL